MTQQEYQADILRQQEEHLRQIAAPNERSFQPCMHNSCPSCVGTGIRQDGSACVHGISCPCPKCSPTSIY